MSDPDAAALALSVSTASLRGGDRGGFYVPPPTTTGAAADALLLATDYLQRHTAQAQAAAEADAVLLSTTARSGMGGGSGESREAARPSEFLPAAARMPPSSLRAGATSLAAEVRSRERAERCGD